MDSIIFIQPLSYKEYTIHSVVIDDKYFYLVRDIALLFDYTTASSIYSIVQKSDILSLQEMYNTYLIATLNSYIDVPLPIEEFKRSLLSDLLCRKPSRCDYNIKFINENGIKSLLARTRKIDSSSLKAMSSMFHIEKDIARPEREEMTFYSLLSGALKSFNLSVNKQVRVGKYYVDFLIPEKNTVIEYDEHNHISYDTDKEKAREEYIRQRGFSIIRINGDMPMSEAFGYALKELDVLLFWLSKTNSSL